MSLNNNVQSYFSTRELSARPLHLKQKPSIILIWVNSKSTPCTTNHVALIPHKLDYYQQHPRVTGVKFFPVLLFPFSPSFSSPSLSLYSLTCFSKTFYIPNLNLISSEEWNWEREREREGERERGREGNWNINFFDPTIKWGGISTNNLVKRLLVLSCL